MTNPRPDIPHDTGTPDDPGTPSGGAVVPDTHDNAHLWNTYRTHPTPELEDALLRAYLPLIRIVMGRRVIPDTIDRDDLAAHLGETLLQAVRTWDPDKATFPTHATNRLLFGIAQYMRDADPISRHARQHVRTVQAFVTTWHHTHGHDPTTDQITNGTGLTPDQVEASFTHYTFSLPTSLDAYEDPDIRDNLGTDPADQTSTAPIDFTGTNPTEDRATKQALLEAMRPLVERDRRVLLLYYWEKLTLKQIAEVFGVTESRISHLHTRAVTLMRGHLHDLLNDDTN